MIQGVRAQSVAFVDLERAGIDPRGGNPLWPQALATGEPVQFTGSQPRLFVIRVSGPRRGSGRSVSCTVQLESPDEPFRAKVKGVLQFSPVPMRSRTKISLEGMAARELVSGKASASTEEVRRVANEYARELVERIASQLEGRTAPEAASRA